MITIVKKILFRRSGTLNMFFRLENVLLMSPLLAWLRQSYPSGGRDRRRSRGKGSPVGEGVALGWRPPAAVWRRQHTHRSTRRLDRPPGRRRKGVGRHVERPRQLAPSEHLDQALLVDQSGDPQHVGRHLP